MLLTGCAVGILWLRFVCVRAAQFGAIKAQIRKRTHERRRRIFDRNLIAAAVRGEKDLNAWKRQRFDSRGVNMQSRLRLQAAAYVDKKAFGGGQIQRDWQF